MHEYDAIVIGAGVNGASAAYHLAKAGQRVLLIEQFAFGHANGSSHGESRIFRFAYAEQPYTRLAIYALPLWRQIEAESGERLLLMTGGLDIATDRAGEEIVQQVIASIRAAGRGFAEYDGAAAAVHFPAWHLPRTAHVVYSPDTGVLRADAVLRALLVLTRAHGGDLHDQEVVTHIDPSEHRVQIRTTHGSYRAARLVVAAGAWTNQLLRQIGVELPLHVTQEQVVYFQPRTNPTRFVAPDFPVWIHHLSPISTYGFPILPDSDPLGRRGIKAAFHSEGPILPDLVDYSRAPRADVTRRLHEYLKTFLPDAAGEPFNPIACLYTNTPDENFIIDQLPSWPNIVVGSACSGHGYKFGIATGKALADLVNSGATDVPVAHCRLAQV